MSHNSLRINLGCDPQHLNDGIHTHQYPHLIILDVEPPCVPLIIIKNGVVCYTGVDAGSAAFNSCPNCDYGAISSCQLNGTWNGDSTTV